MTCNQNFATPVPCRRVALSLVIAACALPVAGCCDSPCETTNEPTPEQCPLPRAPLSCEQCKPGASGAVAYDANGNGSADVLCMDGALSVGCRVYDPDTCAYTCEWVDVRSCGEDPCGAQGRCDVACHPPASP